jgi:hypothetical protein
MLYAIFSLSIAEICDLLLTQGYKGDEILFPLFGLCYIEKVMRIVDKIKV